MCLSYIDRNDMGQIPTAAGARQCCICAATYRTATARHKHRSRVSLLRTTMVPYWHQEKISQYPRLHPCGRVNDTMIGPDIHFVFIIVPLLLLAQCVSDALLHNQHSISSATSPISLPWSQVPSPIGLFCQSSGFLPLTTSTSAVQFFCPSIYF